MSPYLLAHMWATSYSVCAIGKAHPSIFLFKWWSPCVIMSSNVNRRSWEESKSASWRMRSRAQPSVCDWLFSWTQSTDKDSKGGPSGNGIKKMCPASLLQSWEKGSGIWGSRQHSVFSRPLLWAETHFFNCRWLSDTVHTHQSQGLLYLFHLLFPLFLSLFLLPFWCQVFKQPVCVIEASEWAWWGGLSMDSMWPIWPKTLMSPRSLLCCFCLSVRK